MRPYFLSPLLLLFFYSCSSPNGKTATTDTTNKSVQSSLTDSSAPAAGSSPVQTAAERAAIDSRIRLESTLSLGQADMTIPPYGLEKVQAAIGKLLPIDDTSGSGDNFTIALNDPIYSSFSLDEKFTYNLIHAEDYSQMCDILPERTDEARRIYGQLRNLFGEYNWSDRQRAFFSDHKDSVEQLMKVVIDERGSVGMNFLDVIVFINAREMIPNLIGAYHKNNNNHYILTTLMLLMRNNKYPEFMQSSSYKKLYKQDADTYSLFLDYNNANEDLIIKRATNFFNGTSQ